MDTLIIDTTNAQTYHGSTWRCARRWTRCGARGGGPADRVHGEYASRADGDQLFRELYEPGLHRDLWFLWQGKPLLLCDPAEARPEWRDFFTLRRAHWPFTLTNTPYAWHWEATFPQPYGYTDDPRQPEQVNVSVAQNLRQADGQVTNMSDGNARGRSFHQGRQDTAPGTVNWGHDAQEQWQRVFELNPPFAHGDGLERMDCRTLGKAGWTAGLCRPVRPGVLSWISNRCAAAWRPLLSPTGRQYPPIQGRTINSTRI